MNPPSPSHPAAAQWAEYLYDELTPQVRAELDAHARGCPACQAQLAQWRETMGALDSWRVRPRPRALTVFREYARWAAAAGLVLGLGWLGGRFAAPPAPDVQRIRAELQPAVELALRDEFEARLRAGLAAADQRHEDRLVELAQAWATTRAEDQQNTLALYQRGERQRRSEYAALRRDLETVAVVAQDAIGNTQQQLTQLAVNTQATPAGDGGFPR
jgi:hypothetical protein